MIECGDDHDGLYFGQTAHHLHLPKNSNLREGTAAMAAGMNMRRRQWGAMGLIAGALLAQPSGDAAAAETRWHEGFNSKARLSILSVPQNDGQRKAYGFVEIAMPPGWKTYWRNPGDAGGLPPRFDWSRSSNVTGVKVLYPAPRRLTDEAGDTIGYKERVIFPVAFTAVDRDKPVRLALDLSYGICKDVCVPAEAALELEVPAEAAAPADSAALAAIGNVPREAGARRKEDPELRAAALQMDGGPQRLIIDVTFADASGETDVFIESPPDLYVPMARKAAASPAGVQRFEAELGPALDAKDLKGKTLTFTIVGGGGSTEARLTLD
jgi:DsbC/DsbD-like thiol-disulfide interchange protein